MLDPARFTASDPAPAAARPRPVFRMAENDRMAGSVPVWDYRPDAAAAAVAPAAGEAGRTPGTFAQALVDVPDSPAAGAAEEPFGFFDLLDMINPLQHIPILGTLYRNISGDEIKPVSRIIGGTLFGGPAGGASSLANVIIEHETGRDLAGNVIALVQDGETPRWRGDHDRPEQRLSDALEVAAQERRTLADLPPAALSFVDSAATRTPAPVMETARRLTPAEIAALPVIYIEE